MVIQVMLGWLCSSNKREKNIYWLDRETFLGIANHYEKGGGEITLK
jgi:hypothetical protein